MHQMGSFCQTGLLSDAVHRQDAVASTYLFACCVHGNVERVDCQTNHCWFHLLRHSRDFRMLIECGNLICLMWPSMQKVSTFIRRRLFQRSLHKHNRGRMSPEQIVCYFMACMSHLLVYLVDNIIMINYYFKSIQRYLERNRAVTNK